MKISGIKYSNMVPLQESSILTAADHRARAAHREPMLDRDVALGDGDQARQAAFAGQQIVVAGELDRSADGIADREQAPVAGHRGSAC